MMLAGNGAPPAVCIRLLTGQWIAIPVHAAETGTDENGQKYAACTVIKDAGDDPDVTNRAEIGAKVRFLHHTDKITISGGKGVGTITRPGLELPPGEPAINPGPRKMIREAVDDLRTKKGVEKGVNVEVFVPQGETIAKRTLNARLGIIGGISILGTTGVVTPLSHEAYIATIESGLSVAKACGLDTVVLTTGRRSESYAQRVFSDLPEAAFIQMGDFFGRTLQLAGKKGLKQVVLAAFFGKAVKMAQGFRHTHASKTAISMERLARHTEAFCGDAKLAGSVGSANTAREAFFMISRSCPRFFSEITGRMIESARLFSEKQAAVRAVLFDFDGNVISDRKKEKEE